MRVLILGAGAVGGYVGAKLLSAGADVFFLARSTRTAELSKEGLTVTSPLGNFRSAVNAGAAPPSGFVPQVIIIACKAPGLGDAVAAIAPHIASETRLVPLLNGVAHLEMLNLRFPETRVIGGLVHGALTLRWDGVIEHLTPFFSMVAGPVSSPSDPVAEGIVELIGKAGVDARLCNNIRQEMWNKLVFLTTLAAGTCLMRASIGTIVATDHGQEVISRLLEESTAIASVEGFAPDEASMRSYRRLLTERGSSFTSSMLRDILGYRHTEVDHILGDMLRRAQRHGLDPPVLKIAHAHLQCHEAQLA
jgi:2-dehydropantoate 2-reductase